MLRYFSGILLSIMFAFKSNADLCFLLLQKGGESRASNRGALVLGPSGYLTRERQTLRDQVFWP